MTWKERREKMDMAIKEIVIPFLRSNGFKGSYPHFRRETSANLNLLSFQFSLFSAKFVVEIANCPPTGYTTSWGKVLTPAQCRVQYHAPRLRIGSIKHKTDHWYDFEREPLFGNIYKKRAKEIIENWGEAETWWEENPFKKSSV